MDYKTLLGALSAILVVASYLPYINCIIKQKTKPHIFTWIIWSLLTSVAFTVQIVKDAGAGSWYMGVTCILCIIVMLLSIKNGEKTATRSDWCSFIAALCAMPLWYFTKDPTASVILISVTDALGFYPTFRKSWHKPYEEGALFFMCGTISSGLSILSMNHINLHTALYPFSVFLLDGAFVILLLVRRRSIKP